MFMDLIARVDISLAFVRECERICVALVNSHFVTRQFASTITIIVTLMVTIQKQIKTANITTKPAKEQ